MYLLDKETKFIKNSQDKWGLGYQTGTEVAKVVYTAFSALTFLFLVMRISSTLLLQAGSLPQERFISCFQGEKGGSECPSCIRCFLSNFSLK